MARRSEFRKPCWRATGASSLREAQGKSRLNRTSSWFGLTRESSFGFENKAEWGGYGSVTGSGGGGKGGNGVELAGL
jgi:transcription elongation factor